MFIFLHLMTIAIYFSLIVYIARINESLFKEQQKISLFNSPRFNRASCSNNIFFEGLEESPVRVAGKKLPCQIPRLDYAAPGFGYRKIPRAFTMLLKEDKLSVPSALVREFEYFQRKGND